MQPQSQFKNYMLFAVVAVGLIGPFSDFRRPMALRFFAALLCLYDVVYLWGGERGGEAAEAQAAQASAKTEVAPQFAGTSHSRFFREKSLSAVINLEAGSHRGLRG